jgi:hypothetical protein
MEGVVLLCLLAHIWENTVCLKQRLLHTQYTDIVLGRHILNTAEFNVRITVWSLCSTAGVVAALRAPKHAGQGVSASSDGKFLAVAERENCKDHVQIYRCSNWTPIRRFAVDTKDLADLRWAPDDSAIAVWDSVRAFACCISVAYVCLISLKTPRDFFSRGLPRGFLPCVPLVSHLFVTRY